MSSIESPGPAHEAGAAGAVNQEARMPGALNIPDVRERLSRDNGRRYWRGLEELAGTPEFEEFLHREFPREAAVWDNAFSRRNFLKVMGASLALAGLSACTRQPVEKLVPYVKEPEGIIPGKPLAYASATTLAGYGAGILVTSYQGRPTKIEGNPGHPASMGATDIFTQASILTLYDPDRSRVVINDGTIRTWSDFASALQPQMSIQKGLRGAGLRILTPTVTSPTFVDQMRGLQGLYPLAKWHRYEPVMPDSVSEGAELAFGERVETRYAFDKAEVILSIDSDFLGNGPSSVRYSRDFSRMRVVDVANNSMNRLYAVESVHSLTGSNADHRLGLKPSLIAPFARALAAELGFGTAPAIDGIPREWLGAVARDLRNHAGKSIVIAGEYQPAEVHALVHVINAKLGNTGRTVIHTDPVDPVGQSHLESLKELAADIRAKKVDVLIIIEGNPAYDAPADLDFADLMKNVRFTVRLGLYEDETSSVSHWHLPCSHYLEAWSDVRAFDGTVSVVQPLIEPLYYSKSPHEVLAMAIGGDASQGQQSGYDIILNYWKTKGGLPAPFDASWKMILNNGLVANSALPERRVTPKGNISLPATTSSGDERDAFELVFRPDPTVWDGRFNNNGWLQELPKPLSKLTWDNAAMISPADAGRLQLANGDVIEISTGRRSLRIPAWIQPGQPEGSIALHLGYGRSRTGKVGTGTGFNCYTLRTSGEPWFITGSRVTKVGSTYPFASTQEHWSTEGRHQIRTGTLAGYIENPKFAVEEERSSAANPSLYPPVAYDQYKWGMTIDLNACIGCGACTIACQAENNIPVVGKDQVARSREMHWIRVDRFYEGDLAEPQAHFMPVPCMHCENAPCEVVCPVQATVHDNEGLNTMVYNRCIGTRYCSNNCPYKVRRFNFLQYSDNDDQTVAMQKNPEVTVRERGVMEKCTFCVQRISRARIDAKKEDRSIRDGEVTTACQQACPAQAIRFGDLNDKSSAVAATKSDPRNYEMLGELNTHPRTTYLARLKNFNPEMEKGEGDS